MSFFPGTRSFMYQPQLVHLGHWYKQSPAANTGTPTVTVREDAAGNVTDLIVPAPGLVKYITFSSEIAFTLGTFTGYVYVNGVSQASVAFAAASSPTYGTATALSVPLAAGNNLSCYWTTDASFNGTALPLSMDLWGYLYG